MAGQVNAPGVVSMVLDMKRNRIRIHKPAIHMLGNPTLIQLLFDPDGMVVAIVCPDAEVPGGQEVHINPRVLKGRNCFEFCSSLFLRKLRTVYGNLDASCSYRLTGQIYPELHAARFPMNTLRKIECDEGVHGNG